MGRLQRVLCCIFCGLNYFNLSLSVFVSLFDFFYISHISFSLMRFFSLHMYIYIQTYKRQYNDSFSTSFCMCLFIPLSFFILALLLAFPLDHIHRHTKVSLTKVSISFCTSVFVSLCMSFSFTISHSFITAFFLS